MSNSDGIQSSEFSKFIRSASPEEKERVFSKVIDDSIEMQNNGGSSHKLPEDCLKPDPAFQDYGPAKEYYKSLMQLKQELCHQRKIAEEHPATAAFNLCNIVANLIAYMERNYETDRSGD